MKGHQFCSACNPKGHNTGKEHIEPWSDPIGKDVTKIGDLFTRPQSGIGLASVQTWQEPTEPKGDVAVLSVEADSIVAAYGT